MGNPCTKQKPPVEAASQSQGQKSGEAAIVDKKR